MIVILIVVVLLFMVSNIMFVISQKNILIGIDMLNKKINLLTPYTDFKSEVSLYSKDKEETKRTRTQEQKKKASEVKKAYWDKKRQQKTSTFAEVPDIDFKDLKKKLLGEQGIRPIALEPKIRALLQLGCQCMADRVLP